MKDSFPRLFAIVATNAPVAAVLWRGAKGWWSYTLVRNGRQMLLEDVVWADWAHNGRLLLATAKEHLRVCEVGKKGLLTVHEHDLSSLRPSPSPSPEWAKQRQGEKN